MARLSDGSPAKVASVRRWRCEGEEALEEGVLLGISIVWMAGTWQTVQYLECEGLEWLSFAGRVSSQVG